MSKFILCFFKLNINIYNNNNTNKNDRIILAIGPWIFPLKEGRTNLVDAFEF